MQWIEKCVYFSASSLCYDVMTMIKVEDHGNLFGKKSIKSCRIFFYKREIIILKAKWPACMVVVVNFVFIWGKKQHKPITA